MHITTRQPNIAETLENELFEIKSNGERPDTIWLTEPEFEELKRLAQAGHMVSFALKQLEENFMYFDIPIRVTPNYDIETFKNGIGHWTEAQERRRAAKLERNAEINERFPNF